MWFLIPQSNSFPQAESFDIFDFYALLYHLIYFLFSSPLPPTLHIFDICLLAYAYIVFYNKAYLYNMLTKNELLGERGVDSARLGVSDEGVRDYARGSQ